MNILTEIPKSALAVFAHPDDVEVACGGTLAAWAQAGAKCQVVICTRGDKGSKYRISDVDDFVSTRTAEVTKAASILGIDVEFLGIDDGALVHESIVRELVARIRQTQPAAVIGPDPTAVFFGSTYLNHFDHRTLGWALLDAVSPIAGNPNYMPEIPGTYMVPQLLLAGTLDPDAAVDIIGVLDQKVTAVLCHDSQVREPEHLATVIRERAKDEGRACGLQAAERFRRLTLG